MRTIGTYAVLLLVVHEGSNGLTLIGTGPSLSTNADGSMANAKMIGSTGNSVERRRHLVKRLMMWEITGVVDGEQPANGVSYIYTQLGQ